MDDMTLIKGIKNKKQKSLEALIDKYSNYVFVIVKNIVGEFLTMEDIEEICADVFVSIWKNKEKINPEYKELKPYIGAIARNAAKNRLKGIKNIDLDFDDEIFIFDASKVEDEILNNELSQALNESVSSLKEPDREIVVRFYFFYQKVKDIALQLDLNESTVKTKLFRSREKLKNMLMERGFSYEDQSY